MNNNSNITIFCLGLCAVLLLATVHVPLVAESAECVIPPSGPWPSCATGGSGITNPPNNSGSCAIPPSGPWPACAKGGGATNPPTTGGGDGSCVIPPSGPWPACATGGKVNNNDNGTPAFPVVVSILADKSYVLHDDKLTLSWEISNARSVSIAPQNIRTSAFSVDNLPATGSHTFDLSSICDSDGTISFLILATDNNGAKIPLTSFDVASEPHPWFFRFSGGSSRPAVHSCAPAKQTQAAIQEFERGYMIWIAQTDTIYVLYNETVNPTAPRLWQEYRNTFVAGSVESDPSLVVPVGLQQPLRGFGEVWRANNLVNKLGWAKDSEKGFSSTMQSYTQCYSIRCSGATYLVDSSGKMLWSIWYTGSVNWSHQWSLDAFYYDN